MQFQRQIYTKKSDFQRGEIGFECRVKFVFLHDEKSY